MQVVPLLEVARFCMLMSIEHSAILILLVSYFLGGMIFLGFRNSLNKVATYSISITLNLIGILLWWLTSDFSAEPKLLSYDWISVGSSAFHLSFLFDATTWLMLGLVQVVSLAVQLFSIKYMRKDPRFTDYYAFLNLFVGSMLGLVMVNSLLLLFVFWELVGFCSYLLIGFWYHKPAANRAASKAFMLNKIGDAFLLVAIGMLFATFGTLEISSLKIQFHATNHTGIIGFLLVMGSLAKSAQLPLQVWLPDAMEGPTPVSALIHAATMVAAGVFMLARLHFALDSSALQLIAVIGALSALMAGYTALFQWDIKKILAYSTISQLGMMMVGIGIAQPNAALFHLFTHAFYKAGLFLIAGILIYKSQHEQDIRKIKVGGKLLFTCYLLCAASLTGLPFFSGYLSKETLLLSTLNWQGVPMLTKAVVFSLFLISGAFTAIYSTKIAYFVFLKNKKYNQKLAKIGLMELVVILLTFASLGIIHSLHPLHPGDGWFARFLPLPSLKYEWVGYLSVILSLVLIGMSYLFYHKGTPLSSQSWWVQMGKQHFYLNYFYTQPLTAFFIGNTPTDSRPKGLASIFYKFDVLLVDNFINKLAYFSRRVSKVAATIDIKIVDGAVRLITKAVDSLGFFLRRLQSGKLQEYLITTILILIFAAILSYLL